MKDSSKDNQQDAAVIRYYDASSSNCIPGIMERNDSRNRTTQYENGMGLGLLFNIGLTRLPLL